MRTAFICLALTLSYSASAPDDFRPIATVESDQLSECSGLAVSYANSGRLWTHNDSGDEPRLYLLDLQGRLEAIVKIQGAQAVDWEDMCSFQLNGVSWLLVGDIGDNDRKRGKKKPACRLYLIRELKVPRANGLPTLKWKVSGQIEFDFEDGRWDCEGVAVDTQRKEILLLTKAAPHKAGLYSIPLDVNDEDQKQTAKRIATPFIPFATALDISPDGRDMIVGSMLSGLLVTRQKNQSWKDAFDTPGKAIELPPRPQGESVCFDWSGNWLFLNSEGRQEKLWRIPSQRDQGD